MQMPEREIQMSTTYTKLRSGEWGLRFTEDPPPIGSAVTVQKRDGTAKTETVGSVVWQNQEITLTTIARARKSWVHDGRGCHTDGECSSVCRPSTCPCGDGSWFRCC